MARAILLIAGVLLYLAGLHIGRDVAMAGVYSVQNFYTSASGEADRITASNR